MAAILSPRGSGSSTSDIDPGTSAPIGPTFVPGGVNFSVYAQHATGVDLLLFDDPADAVPGRVVTLDRRANRTGGYWHTFVPGLRAGATYAYRATGPWAPEAGLRFDDRSILLDPYGRGVAVPAGYTRDMDPTAPDEERVGRAMKSVLVDLAVYDWDGDQPLGRP